MSDLIYTSTDYNKYMIHSMHDWLQKYVTIAI